MPTNRIAVYGHRGWASSVIVKKLADSGALHKVLYRPGSDVSSIPPNIITVKVDVEEQPALIEALQDVDILISLVGHEGVSRQRSLVKAIPSTSVRLFVPSDLAFRCDDLGLEIPMCKEKRGVETMAKAAKIPTTIVLPGSIVEPFLSTTMLGVDVSQNSIVFMGESANEKMHACTIAYVASAYVSIFASTPLSKLQDRVIGLSELQISGSEIASALERRHKKHPEIRFQSLDQIDEEYRKCLEEGDPMALAWYCRRVWASGQFVNVIGTDIFEVPGSDKVTIDSLLVGGDSQPYRELPPFVKTRFDAMQEKSVKI